MKYQVINTPDNAVLFESNAFIFVLRFLLEDDQFRLTALASYRDALDGAKFDEDEFEDHADHYYKDFLSSAKLDVIKS